MAGPPDPKALELLREQSGLSVNREGTMLHHGQPIPHQRTREVLQRGLTVRPDGRVVVYVGEQWAYVDVEDTAFVARNIRAQEANTETGAEPKIDLILTDGRVFPLACDYLALGITDRLYTWCVALNSWVGFSRAAQANMAPFLDEAPDTPVGVCLSLGEVKYPIQVYETVRAAHAQGDGEP